jgi:diguanylate cyclase (GGDEF)-like protein
MEESTRSILGRTLDEFRDFVFEGDHGERFSLTFSAGIATFPTDGRTLEALIRAADQRLCVAKDKGRNRIEIAV